MIKELDIRDIAIIDAFPVYNCPRSVLTVGAGGGRLEHHLAGDGLFYDVLATDMTRMVEWEDRDLLRFKRLDILNPEGVNPSPIVVCSEVLEHILDWRKALANLLDLTIKRLIITIPFDRSFSSPDHVNRWVDKTVKEFHTLCKPFTVSISKIRTKPRDVEMKQWCYLIIVDRRQRWTTL